MNNCLMFYIRIDNYINIIISIEHAKRFPAGGTLLGTFPACLQTAIKPTKGPRATKRAQGDVNHMRLTTTDALTVSFQKEGGSISRAVGLGLFLSAALSVGLPLPPLQAGDMPGSESPALEQFKQFISSPPSIRNLVWQQKVPMEGGQRPLDGTFALSTRFDYFQARWQTNGMLFRRLNRPEDATNYNFAGTLVSVSDHQHALVEPGGHLTTWDDRDPSVSGKNISVFYTTQLALDPLREILNLGTMRAGLGTIRWDGNRFRTECEVDHERLLITGELVPSGDAPPIAMRVCYSFPHQTNRYVLRYGYAPSLKYPFLPATITNFWVTETRRGVETEIELDQWRILALELAEAPPLPAQTFDLAPFQGQSHWATRIYTNGALYTRQTNGTLQFVVSLNAPKAPLIPRFRASPKTVYACWVGLNFGIFALMLGAKVQEQTQNRKNTSYEI